MSSKPGSSAELAALLAEARAALTAHADPDFRATMQSFFKEEIYARGVRSAAVQKIAAGLYGQIKGWPLQGRNRLCNELWKSGVDEEGTLAIYLYRRFRKQCAACEFHLFEKWIDRYVRNWGHCDGVSHYLISASIENDPALVFLLPPWTESANRWKRRAAAVSLVHGARRGRSDVAIILDVAERLAGDEDDLVRKGLGWLLKESYGSERGEIMRFLKARKQALPRLVLRIASEKMTPADRRAVLA
jgi:3-methyladenine DNA glycosylase AlkD